MNRPSRTSASLIARRRETAPRAARQLLVAVLTLAACAPVGLFNGGNRPNAPSPIVAPSSSVAAAPSESAPPRPTTEQVREAYGQIPMSFEANRGQAGEGVNFVARGAKPDEHITTACWVAIA